MSQIKENTLLTGHIGTQLEKKKQKKRRIYERVNTTSIETTQHHRVKGVRKETTFKRQIYSPKKKI